VSEFTNDFKIDTNSSFRRCPNLLEISRLIQLVLGALITTRLTSRRIKTNDGAL
jgi:hypothetical protein